MTTRSEMWNQLEGSFDVLVVGGGINGAGIARDAALRGLRVALVEMRDLAFGTSSRSSKLVHGGLRYLEQFELGLVFESVNERGILMKVAPHLVHPLGFVFPVYNGARVPLWKMRAGVWLYHLLCLQKTPGRWRMMWPRDLEREEPSLDRNDLNGAPLYFDCSTDDARLTLESALDASEAGATVVTYAKVTGFVLEQNRIVGAHVRDELSGEVREIRASVVVNATGPWTDRTLAMSPGNGAMLRPTKGTHIVVRHTVLPVTHAVVCMHPRDGRVLFAIPWGEETYLGTTDTDFDGDPAHVYASGDDVRYIIEAAARYFPAHPIHPDDVLSTWAGLRPLVAGGDEKNVSESSISREHTIQVGQDGLISVAGGKLTTFRKMAAEVVESVLKQLRAYHALPEGKHPAPDRDRVLPGAQNWPAGGTPAIVAQALQTAGPILSKATAELLAATYGTRAIEIAELLAIEHPLAAPITAGRPEIIAQIDFAVHRELACTVTDVLKQRTQIYYRAADQGLSAVERVATHMAQLLGWSAEERQRSIDEYVNEVENARSWRHEYAEGTNSAA
jgi:glycerol-3-phosphate dehydrogenase